MLKNKIIILGVSGGIAAYKSCAIVSKLKDLGADVFVVMTKEAAHFVGAQTFKTLSGNPVIIGLFENETSEVPHISLTEKADLIVIAPATANIIGKIANGIADDALTTIIMASKSKKLIAPAMNPNMWSNQIVKDNIEKLMGLEFNFIGPEEGKLACGDHGIGRMSEPHRITEEIIKILKPGLKEDLAGKSILISAGGTREAIDPIRFIGNRSSGKMGYALAAAARSRGAKVKLVSGPTSLIPPSGVETVFITTTDEMHQAIINDKDNFDAIIMAAAVADFRPSAYLFQKLKKDDGGYSLKLSKTVDILADLGRRKNGTLLIGFAAETENLIDNAKEKLKKKNLDLIIANDESALEADESKVIIIDREGKIDLLPKLGKAEVAGRILDAILRL